MSSINDETTMVKDVLDPLWREHLEEYELTMPARSEVGSRIILACNAYDILMATVDHGTEWHDWPMLTQDLRRAVAHSCVIWSRG